MAAAPLMISHSNPGVYQAFYTFRQFVLAAFRPLRLQILPQLTTWRNSREFKKTAIYQSRQATCLCILLHAIPIALGTTLVVLNIRTTFIDSMSPSGLTALQFASKLLELFMQASITAITLAFVRFQLLGPNELPFGALIAPYRMTDVSTLWSLELWGCLTSTNVNPMLRIALAILFPTAIVLTALVGPSSAVLMIPRPANHLYSDILQLYNPSSVVYPQSVGLLNGSLLAEAEFNATSFQAIFGFSEAAPTPVIDRFGTRDIQVLENFDRIRGDDADWYDFRSVATIPSAMSAQGLYEGGVLSAYNTARTLQPYVHNDCYLEQDIGNITDPANQYLDFGAEKSYLKNVLPFAAVLPDSTQTAGDPSAPKLSMPYLYGDTNCSWTWSKPPIGTSNISLISALGCIQPSNGSWTTFTCVTAAYWATATADMSFAGILSNELPPNDIDAETFSWSDDKVQATLISSLDDKALITLEPQWAERVFAISMALADSSATSLTGSDRGAIDFFIQQEVLYPLALSYIPQSNLSLHDDASHFTKTYSTPQNQTSMTAEQYAAMLEYIDAQNLRHRHDTVEVFANHSDWTDPASLAQIEVKIYSVGYGYNTSTTAVKLSLAVLLSYLILATSYLVCTVYTGIVATSWDSTAELVTLALNSEKVKDLDNTSVGIETLETFRRPANIRVNHEESLEIVFDAARQKAGSYTRVIPNKKY